MSLSPETCFRCDTGGTIPSTDSGRNSRNSGLGRGFREQRAAFEEAFRNRFPEESSFSKVDFWNLFPTMDSDSEGSSGDSQDSSVPFRLGPAVFPPSSPPLQEVPESFCLGLAVFTPSINILPPTPPRMTQLGILRSTSTTVNTTNTTNTTMATHTYTMPAMRHHTAPKFSVEQPRELKHYFKELKNLMSQAGIMADAEKKKQAVRYLDVDAVDMWKSLPTYAMGDYQT